VPDPKSRPSLAEFGNDDLGLSPEQQQQLRQYGTELLKRGMWKDLGIDYTTQGQFDDSPTMEQFRRQNAFGRPSADDLKEREIQMEQRLVSPPDERAWHLPPQNNINLEPVEHNPFGVMLVPVDHDPFSRG
jgi:hypothetical protein